MRGTLEVTLKAYTFIPNISTALMKPRGPKQYCLLLYIVIYILYIGLSYHICGKLEVASKGSPSSQHQHCTDEAQKAETVLSAVNSPTSLRS